MWSDSVIYSRTHNCVFLFFFSHRITEFMCEGNCDCRLYVGYAITLCCWENVGENVNTVSNILCLKPVLPLLQQSVNFMIFLQHLWNLLIQEQPPGCFICFTNVFFSQRLLVEDSAQTQTDISERLCSDCRTSYCWAHYHITVELIVWKHVSDIT